MRQVSTDIAHHLRTPIQRVAVLLDQLEATQLSEGACKMIADARAETAQIVETFRSLLQISRLESGQARSGFTTVRPRGPRRRQRRRLRPGERGARPCPWRDDRRCGDRPRRPHAVGAIDREPDQERAATHAARADSYRRCRRCAACFDGQRRRPRHRRGRTGKRPSPPLPARAEPNERRQRPRPEPPRCDSGTSRRPVDARGFRAGAECRAIIKTRSKMNGLRRPGPNRLVRLSASPRKQQMPCIDVPDRWPRPRVPRTRSRAERAVTWGVVAVSVALMVGEMVTGALFRPSCRRRPAHGDELVPIPGGMRLWLVRPERRTSLITGKRNRYSCEFKTGWQRALGAACAHGMDDRVHGGAHVGLTWPFGERGRR